MDRSPPEAALLSNRTVSNSSKRRPVPSYIEQDSRPLSRSPVGWHSPSHTVAWDEMHGSTDDQSQQQGRHASGSSRQATPQANDRSHENEPPLLDFDDPLTSDKLILQHPRTADTTSLSQRRSISTASIDAASKRPLPNVPSPTPSRLSIAPIDTTSLSNAKRYVSAPSSASARRPIQSQPDATYKGLGLGLPPISAQANHDDAPRTAPLITTGVRLGVSHSMASGLAQFAHAPLSPEQTNTELPSPPLDAQQEQDRRQDLIGLGDLATPRWTSQIYERRWADRPVSTQSREGSPVSRPQTRSLYQADGALASARYPLSPQVPSKTASASSTPPLPQPKSDSSATSRRPSSASMGKERRSQPDETKAKKRASLTSPAALSQTVMRASRRSHEQSLHVNQQATSAEEIVDADRDMADALRKLDGLSAPHSATRRSKEDARRKSATPSLPVPVANMRRHSEAYHLPSSSTAAQQPGIKRTSSSSRATRDQPAATLPLPPTPNGGWPSSGESNQSVLLTESNSSSSSPRTMGGTSSLLLRSNSGTGSSLAGKRVSRYRTQSASSSATTAPAASPQYPSQALHKHEDDSRDTSLVLDDDGSTLAAQDGSALIPPVPPLPQHWEKERETAAHRLSMATGDHARSSALINDQARASMAGSPKDTSSRRTPTKKWSLTSALFTSLTSSGGSSAGSNNSKSPSLSRSTTSTTVNEPSFDPATLTLGKSTASKHKSLPAANILKPRRDRHASVRDVYSFEPSGVSGTSQYMTSSVSQGTGLARLAALSNDQQQDESPPLPQALTDPFDPATPTPPVPPTEEAERSGRKSILDFLSRRRKSVSYPAGSMQARAEPMPAPPAHLAASIGSGSNVTPTAAVSSPPIATSSVMGKVSERSRRLSVATTQLLRKRAKTVSQPSAPLAEAASPMAAVPVPSLPVPEFSSLQQDTLRATSHVSVQSQEPRQSGSTSLSPSQDVDALDANAIDDAQRASAYLAATPVVVTSSTTTRIPRAIARTGSLTRRTSQIAPATAVQGQGNAQNGMPSSHNALPDLPTDSNEVRSTMPAPKPPAPVSRSSLYLPTLSSRQKMVGQPAQVISGPSVKRSSVTLPAAGSTEKKVGRSMSQKLNVTSRFRTSVNLSSAGSSRPSSVASSLAGSSRGPTPQSTSSLEERDRLADQEMAEFVERQIHKRAQAGASRAELRQLCEFPGLAESLPARQPGDALLEWYSQLTPYEHDEVLEYDEVYFGGLKADKIAAVRTHTTQNYGFDDERGDYIVKSHDHVCFRYEIVGTLGKGSFGQVLQCRDHKTGQTVALKIIRNKKRFHHQALVEIKVLENLRKWDPDDECYVLKMTQHFEFRGHLCIVNELLGMNLYELIKANSFVGFSTNLIRRFATQILEALVLLRHHRVVHCDLKPENILLRHPTKSGVKVIDFGSSCFENEKIYTYIQSRFYRSPEVILGMDYHMAIDMFSLGAICAELYTGYPIFPGENEQEQLACIMEIMGLPERHIIDRASRRKLFLGRKRRPGTKNLAQVLNCDDELFVDFIARCLAWDPDRRIQPARALRHPFIRPDVVVPLPTVPIASTRLPRMSVPRDQLARLPTAPAAPVMASSATTGQLPSLTAGTNGNSSEMKGRLRAMSTAATASRLPRWTANIAPRPQQQQQQISQHLS
ncbi:hypothetical protein E5Q_05214 [Mixia osmundae IAM 14324]|uniref:dual-specificity kinase n=1 Tax=Mixia osmundae (strain CBS 9802 / IAM 14324 / JCM 22182 / KY 12970) TaxID=764103 RepID=G7E6R7_MIXOS|nr:hypothetical protein E5Q_05214 [Mixia osmundae IAM 14324]